MTISQRSFGGDEHAAGGDAGSYERLADIYHHLLSEQTLDVLLDLIANALAELIPYDTLTIYQADHAHEVLVPVLVRDVWADEVLATRPAFGAGITGWVVDNREPVLSNQAHLDERVDQIPGTPAEPEALISVPLVARESIKGALNIYRQGAGASFHEQEFHLAQRFADAAALAIDNAQIRAALEHQAQTDPLTGLYNHRYFHERVRSELMRTSRTRDAVTILLFDIDDFKRLNDVHGHADGDQVLIRLAEVLRATVRASDVACRVGGEEFGVILPSCGAADAMGLARRLRDRTAVLDMEGIGGIKLSLGIAQGPDHAMNPRELVSCAEMAMMTAKARGKDQAVLYSPDDVERPVEPSISRDVRSIAHLKMLQSLAGKLNRLNEVRHIADTIANELRTLIDYHNCRVYLAEGGELFPVAFRGQLAIEGAEQAEVLPVGFGEGIAGRAAADGSSLLIPNALECDFAIHLPGTEEIEESIIAVPMLYGSRVNGVVLLSKLGVAQFDEDDVRLLEVLAGQASVAMENARLYESQRREAENARALLEVSDRLVQAPSFHAVGNLAADEVARLMGSDHVTLWMQGTDGDYRCSSHHGFAGDPEGTRLTKRRFTQQEADLLHSKRTRPFVVTAEEFAQTFPEQHGTSSTLAIVPLRQEGEMSGWLAVRQPVRDHVAFSEEQLRLLEGLGQQISLALQKATLYREQKEAADVASSLLELSHVISSVDNLELLLERVVERSASILGAPQSQLWLEEPGSGDVVCEAAWGLSPNELEKLAALRFPVEEAAPLLTRGEPFSLAPAEYESIARIPLVGHDVTYALAPFAVEGRLACLIVSAPALGDYEFSERKFHLLAGIADQAKLALTNASAYQALEETFVSTVEALANALEANDEYTSTHARSIAEMTREVGELAGLDPVSLKRLEMASLFHDIGKIGIPSEILLKEGPLEDTEWEIMRLHPELGARILEPIDRLADVRPIVRACHEHYDGSGYPDGTAGENIPLEARIILVCDAFHAMTSDRPYRAALPVEDAIERLRLRAGTQFDPHVVELFLQLLERQPDLGMSR